MQFGIAGWAAWTGGTEEGVVPDVRPAVSRSIPVNLRRRITPIGRKALEAAWSLLPDGGAPRLVLSSRHGEYQRTFGLLESLDEEKAVSPAEFSLSVHHSLVGLLSIETGNIGGHTAVAAGPSSFAYGLLEAVAILAETGGQVLLIHFDEPPPAIYEPVVTGDEPALVLAMLLDARGTGRRIALDCPDGEWMQTEGMARQFLSFLEDGGSSSGSGGAVAGWRWRNAA